MISQSRYIKIVSGVGAGAVAAQRQLILRLITQNTVLPPGIVAEFSTSDAVGAYFGTSSEEYKRALAYFAFISKNITSPSTISFARYVSAAIAPMVVGDSTAKSLALLQQVTTPTLTLDVNGVADPITAISFASAESLTDIASELQTAIRANSNAQLTNATVTFNTNTNQFVLTGTTTGAGTITAVATGLASDVSQLLGWATTGTVNVTGQAADTPDVAVSKSANISNNMGSFAFCNSTSVLSNSDIALVAAWNDSQNNMYMYSTTSTLANLGTLYPLVQGYSGCAINLVSSSLTNDFVEQSPCEILAATDYTRVNATQNYMYYQFASRNVTVSDDTTADTVDALRGNYIGQTQSAGQPLSFYQRGVLCGGSTAAVDMNTYANEMWLKSALGAQLLTLFLAVGRVPANNDGKATILAVMQSTITTAKNNGTISAGKTLTAVQQQFITQTTGDSNAWRQVATIGYWLDIEFESITNPNSGLVEWEATYTLIYSKDDAIRSVVGSNVMI